MSSLFLALSLCLAPTASALPSVDGTWPKTTQRHPEDAAVVVGIEDYGTLPDTPYAVNDAVGFRRYLLYARGLSNRRIHIKTRQSEDAPHVTAGEIEQLVRKAALEAGPKGTVWVYFSGHGFVMDGERLLLDSEARQDAMRARAVTDTQLREWASSEGSKVVLVVDACYNGQLRGGGELFAGARSIVGPSFALPVEAASVDWVAAQPNQRAYPLAAAEHGAFTYHLLGALRGWADGELDGQRDGEVTAAEADAYVVRMFEDQGSQAKGQMPQLSTASAGSWVFSTATEAAPLVVVEASDVQAAMAKVERPGEVIGKLGYKMVRIQPGTFTMGSPSTERGRDSDETQHQVTLTRAFLMGTTEVTQGLYGSVMGSNPSRFSSCGPRCPVEQVSWFDAMRFANKLSEREGLVPVYQLRVEEVMPNWSANGYRLPTEAEWEFAARAGEATLFSGGDRASEVGWLFENSGGKTHPVAQKRANGWGLYDMTGNVWEWTWDWYSSYPRSATDPAGATRGSSRVARGGSWLYAPALARVANRLRFAPSTRRSDLGFRLSRSAP